MNTLNESFDIFRGNLNKEITAFRKLYYNMERVRIYNDYYIIGFHEEYFEMFMSNYIDDRLSDDEIKWLVKFENPLAFLYDEWMSCDGAFSHDWEDMLNFVHETYRYCGGRA